MSICYEDNRIISTRKSAMENSFLILDLDVYVVSSPELTRSFSPIFARFKISVVFQCT